MSDLQKEATKQFRMIGDKRNQERVEDFKHIQSAFAVPLKRSKKR